MEWLQQLRLVWIGRAVARNQETTLKFRTAYLRRLRLVSAERVNVPVEDRPYESFFWHVDRELKLLDQMQ